MSLVKRRCLYTCAIFLAVLAELSHAFSTPRNWPWHGVSMDNISSSPSDIHRFKRELGINSVRLQVKIQKYAARKGVSQEAAWEESLAWLHSMLDACVDADIVAVVNVSSFIFDPKVQYDMRSPEVWDGGTFFTHIRSSVTRLLSAVEDRGEELVAFDFISEPVVRENGDSRAPKLWPKLVADISRIMESRSPDRWLVVSSAPWGTAKGYINFSPLKYNRVIYGVHIYMPHAFTHQGIKSSLTHLKYPGWVRLRYWDKQKIEEKLKPLREFQEKHNVPVLVGEFSAVRWADGGEKYIEDVASIANGYNWGWLYFSATGWHGWNPDYSHRNSWDENDRSYLENDRVGDMSERWVTLRKIFNVNKKGITP